jgi:hypothetical protein
LAAPIIDETLKHPLSRAGSPMLAELQTVLALVPKPDAGALGDYCEALGDGE